MSLAGCTQFRKVMIPDEETQLSGAGSLIIENGNASQFEQLSIGRLLSEYGFEEITQTSGALATQPYQLVYRRNELQDRILAASNQRCGSYLRMIVSVKSHSQVGWGGLATLLSGAAAVITPANTAKSFAAGATIASGFNTLYNEAYFNNLAVNVIPAGIPKQREGILAQIEEKRKLPLPEYSVNRAIADALTYHSSCNIISGLEAAATATKLSDSTIAAEKAKSDEAKKINEATAEKIEQLNAQIKNLSTEIAQIGVAASNLQKSTHQDTRKAAQNIFNQTENATQSLDETKKATEGLKSAIERAQESATDKKILQPMVAPKI